MQVGLKGSFVLLVLGALLANSVSSFNWDDDPFFTSNSADNWDNWDSWGGWPDWGKLDDYDKFKKWAETDDEPKANIKAKDTKLQRTLISMRGRELSFLRKVMKLANQLRNAKGGDIGCLVNELTMMTKAHKNWFRALMAKADLPPIKPCMRKRPAYKRRYQLRKRPIRKWKRKTAVVRKKRRRPCRKCRKQKDDWKIASWSSKDSDGDSDGWIGFWNGKAMGNQNKKERKKENGKSRRTAKYKWKRNKPKCRSKCNETKTHNEFRKKLKNGGFIYSNTSNHTVNKSSFSSTDGW